jgi:flagellar motility protein MotE (MotC chaperone)
VCKYCEDGRLNARYAHGDWVNPLLPNRLQHPQDAINAQRAQIEDHRRKEAEMKRKAAIEKEKKRMLNRLKNFDAEQNNLEDLIELSAFGTLVAAEYTSHTIPVPEWLNDNLAAVKQEVKRRNEDYLRKQLKEVEIQLGALKTKEEKKSELLTQVEKLKSTLGIT